MGFYRPQRFELMNNNGQTKWEPRPRERTRTEPWGLAILIVVAVTSLMPCCGQTDTSEAGTSDVVQEDLSRILGETDVVIEHADQEYAETVDAVDKSYEQALLKAQTLWSARIAEVKAEAVSDLKTLSSRLAAAGQLGEMIQVLKAVYGLTREDREVAEALVAAGVDLKTIQLQQDYFARREGRQTTRIVLWNTHNSRFNTSGTQQCNVVLFQAGKSVWRKDKVNLPWEPNNDTFAVVNVPALKFDVVRVEIIKWQGYSGGMTEIEVWQGGKNVAIHRPTRASSAVDRQTMSATVTDGVTTSVAYKNGYWLLPDNQAGWIEVSLGGLVYRRVQRAKVLARKPWHKVLEVSEGDIIDITANGKWRAAPQIPAGPDGGLGPGGDQYGKYRDRFYLQGRLDEDVFKIGSHFTLHVPKDGSLELGMSEADIAWFANNSGFVDVTLRVRKDSSPPVKHADTQTPFASMSGRGLAATR